MKYSGYNINVFFLILLIPAITFCWVIAYHDSSRMHYLITAILVLIFIALFINEMER